MLVQNGPRLQLQPSYLPQIRKPTGSRCRSTVMGDRSSRALSARRKCGRQGKENGPEKRRRERGGYRNQPAYPWSAAVPNATPRRALSDAFSLTSATHAGTASNGLKRAPHRPRDTRMPAQASPSAGCQLTRNVGEGGTHGGRLSTRPSHRAWRRAP
jgi:hypothetical protein